MLILIQLVCCSSHNQREEIIFKKQRRAKIISVEAKKYYGIYNFLHGSVVHILCKNYKYIMLVGYSPYDNSCCFVTKWNGRKYNYFKGEWYIKDTVLKYYTERLCASYGVGRKTSPACCCQCYAGCGFKKCTTYIKNGQIFPIKKIFLLNKTGGYDKKGHRFCEIYDKL